MNTSALVSSLLRVGFGAVIVASLATGGCGGPVGDEEAASADSKSLDGMLRRVVAARMYQRGHWTIPAADHYRPDVYPPNANGKPNLDQRAAYVCNVLAYLRPTYVEGLVRVDAGEDDDDADGTDEDAKLADEAYVFDQVKSCVRAAVPGHEVKFDVVLNALQYTDPEFGVNSADEGAKKIRGRLRQLDALFHPDAWFFDFYTKPWNQDGKTHYQEAMRAGISWIHDKTPNHDRQLVGGNAWGSNIPDKTDFIAITDKDGMDSVNELTDKINAQHIPLVMHIRNDPQVHKSEGVWWNERGPDYRRSVLEAEVEGADRGYRYMYPVFFPLKEHTKKNPGPRESYDAAGDHNLLYKMCTYLDGNDDRCGDELMASSKIGLSGNGGGTKDPDEAPYIERVAVHRAFNGAAQQHLFSTSLTELENGPGLAVEETDAFFLESAGAADGSVPFHRCYLGHGWHLLTPVDGCEGASGAIDEGVMGQLFTGPVDGAVPLYRLFRAAAPDHFYTVDPDERDSAIALGYSDEGITGYVFEEP